MSETLEVLFGLFGGLALFLFGMNSMSEALQKAAGEKMKTILALLTKNRVLGAVAGALVTAVLQSSSATTVMVIGFVSAGLMTLPQGISVIFGANIGTTITAQLMAFKISDYIYPIIFIGFLIQFLAKKEKPKAIGTVIFSFGVLFEGIEIMGSVMKPLASSPIFTDLMAKVTDIPLLGVLLGTVMTVVVQSSSATIAVLQNFASQAAADGVTSIMGLSGAIPILLGDNIGTTITALLACIGQSKNAKRTAVAHSIFNISGSLVFLFLIPAFTKVVIAVSPTGNEVDVISRQIANAHTIFNCTVAVVWLIFLPVMVKIVTTLIKDKPEDKVLSPAVPQYLDNTLLHQPNTALYLVTKELGHSAECGRQMIDFVYQETLSNEAPEAQEAFDGGYRDVKSLQEDISDYITELLTTGRLNEQQAEQAAALLYVNNNVERIADRCNEVVGSTRKIASQGQAFSEDARKQLGDFITTLSGMFAQSFMALENGSESDAKAVIKNRNELLSLQKKMRKAHLKRVRNGVCSAAVTGDYDTILYNLERIADSCASIAEESLENLNFSDFELPMENLKEGGEAN